MDKQERYGRSSRITSYAPDFERDRRGNGGFFYLRVNLQVGALLFDWLVGQVNEPEQPIQGDTP